MNKFGFIYFAGVVTSSVYSYKELKMRETKDIEYFRYNNGVRNIILAPLLWPFELFAIGLGKFIKIIDNSIYEYKNKDKYKVLDEKYHKYLEEEHNKSKESFRKYVNKPPRIKIIIDAMIAFLGSNSPEMDGLLGALILSSFVTNKSLMT